MATTNENFKTVSADAPSAYEGFDMSIVFSQENVETLRVKYQFGRYQIPLVESDEIKSEGGNFESGILKFKGEVFMYRYLCA